MFKINQKQYFSFFISLLILFIGAQASWAAYTIEDEKKVGKEIYDKLEKNNFLLHDKKLNAYIESIGNRVLFQSSKANFDYTFSIFNSSAINAFATPGGYIYVNKGLITAVENEAQLAAVIAHEIGHANARHVASIIEKSTKLNIAMLAAIIAGAFLGGGGEATAAIAAFSIAGASTMSLKYQREHEEEADRMGIDYLVRAGYYPQAMVDFLKIIKQYDFLSRSIPSYLKTHPGTDDRIFYLESIVLTQYSQQAGQQNIVGNFIRMQSLVAQDADDLKRRSHQLSQTLIKDPGNIDLLYALGMTENQLGHMDIALEHFNKALSLSTKDDEDLLLACGQTYLKTQNPAKARPLLLKASLINPENEQTLLSLGKANFALGDFQNALNCFLKLESKITPDSDIYYLIAMSYGRLGLQGESHYYFGWHFKKEKKTQSAIFHFRAAQNFYPKGSDRSNIIDEAIRDLEMENTRKPLFKNRPPSRFH